MGNDEVTRFVEDSDCVILLGTFMTDIEPGHLHGQSRSGQVHLRHQRALRIRHHHFHGVLLADFIRELADGRPQPPRPASFRTCPDSRSDAKFVLQPDEPITIRRMIARLNESLDDETIVIADMGDSLFAATELVIRGRTEFVSPAYYTSMGFSIPAAVGTQVARPDLRAVVIVGDGAFQMTGMELSTIVRHGFRPRDPCSTTKATAPSGFLHPGNRSTTSIPGPIIKLPQVLGGGTGYEVRTEGEFDAALRKAWREIRAASV